MICSLKDSTVHGISQAGSGLPFPTPGNLLDLGIKAASLASPALAGRCFTVVPPGKPKGLVQLAYKTFCYFFFFFFRRNVWSPCLFNLYAEYIM